MRFVRKLIVVIALAACGGRTTDGSDGSSSGSTTGTSTGSPTGTSSSSMPSSSSGSPNETQCVSVVQQSGIRTVRVGVDTEGRAVVLLDFGRAGECRAEEGALLHAASLVVMSVGYFMLAPGKRELNEASVTKSGPSSYAWTDRNLSLQGASSEPAPSLHLKLKDAEREQTIVCEPGVHEISCIALE